MTEKNTAPVKDTQWLTALINEKVGTSYSAFQIRTLLRKLIKEGAFEREEGRYVFTGERDPRVLAVLKAIKAGAMEAEKKERTTKAKATSKAKAAAAEEAPKPRRSRKPKAAPVVEDDDDVDLDEI